MENLYIKKVANGFVVEIGFMGDEDETYIFPNQKAVVANFEELFNKAIMKGEENKKKAEERRVERERVA